MIERGHCTSFTLKASPTVIIVRHSGRQHLDGYVAAEARVAGAKDLAHAAGSQGREDFVRSEFCAWRERHSPDPVQCSRSEGSSPCYARRFLWPPAGAAATLSQRIGDDAST